MLGTLIIPFTFTLLWLSVFGNSALYEIIHGGAAFAEEAMVHPERGFLQSRWRSIRRLPLAPPSPPLLACCFM
ncbi:hypothetical protein ACP0HM_35150 [Escherichia coli]